MGRFDIFFFELENFHGNVTAIYAFENYHYPLSFLDRGSYSQHLLQAHYPLWSL